MVYLGSLVPFAALLAAFAHASPQKGKQTAQQAAAKKPQVRSIAPLSFRFANCPGRNKGHRWIDDP